jgi:hypothetical protein
MSFSSATTAKCRVEKMEFRLEKLNEVVRCTQLILR